MGGGAVGGREAARVPLSVPGLSVGEAELSLAEPRQSLIFLQVTDHRMSVEKIHFGSALGRAGQEWARARQSRPIRAGMGPQTSIFLPPRGPIYFRRKQR